jgi:hypothetical protein
MLSGRFVFHVLWLIGTVPHIRLEAVHSKGACKQDLSDKSVQIKKEVRVWFIRIERKNGTARIILRSAH